MSHRVADEYASLYLFFDFFFFNFYLRNEGWYTITRRTDTARARVLTIGADPVRVLYRRVSDSVFRVFHILNVQKVTVKPELLFRAGKHWWDNQRKQRTESALRHGVDTCKSLSVLFRYPSNQLHTFLHESM